MKFTLLAVLLLLIQTAQAIELRYKWKAGTSYRFTCDQVDEVSMGGSMGAGMPGMPDMGGMMSMAGNQKFKTTSTFSLSISKVNPDGSALGMFALESFRVTEGSGRAIATLANIPKGMLKAPFSVDELGNFDFTQIPVLIVDQETGQASLTIAVVQKGEVASAEVVVDGERIKLYAEFSKSGQLKAGYSVTSVGTPKHKTMQVSEDDEVIDLIPTDYLEMFVLPEGDVKAGQSVRMAAAGTEQTFKVASIAGSIASLQTTIGQAMSSAKMKQMGDDAAAAEGDEPMEEDEEIPTIASETQATITTQFDNGVGMFKGLVGKASTQMNMMGMEVTHKGTFAMRRL